MTTATAPKVVLDRELVYDLLVEIHAVNTVIARITGVLDVDLTSALMLKAEALEESSPVFDSPREDDGYSVLWTAGDRRADELMGRSGDAS